jgi:diadenosine tetraphosphatase ApaH/serine/threonine PP2A family protein phosphatase
LRSLIVADVHANLEALESVIVDAGKNGGFDQVWSLGDIVGYGANPAECIELLREYDAMGIAGNHDLAACGKIAPDGFSKDATAAVWWTISKLTFEQYTYLRDLPLSMQMESFTLVHGSARAPFWSEYVETAESARVSFDLMSTPRCLVGHSHRQLMWLDHGGSVSLQKPPIDTPIVLGANRLIINPGAVGQPRDADPRASYAVYDSRDMVVTFHRVAYDRPATQHKMQEAGLPQYLWTRLEYGL